MILITSSRSFNDFTSNYIDTIYTVLAIKTETYWDSGLASEWKDNMSLSNAYDNEPSIRCIVDKTAVLKRIAVFYVCE